MPHAVIKRYFTRLLRPVLAIALILGWATTVHATLYVIVLDNREIAIASDSRWMWLEGRQVKTSDGVEKVIPLGTRLAFMSSGLTQLSGATFSVQPAQIVRICYTGLVKNSHHVSMKELAAAFARLTTDHLNRLSDSERAAVGLLAQRLGFQDNIMESMIAGLDSDGALKVETIDFSLSSTPSPSSGGPRFDWTLAEALAMDSPRVILSGGVEVLKNAFQDDASPIRQLPSFTPWAQAMQEGKQVNAVQTAEALVDLTIKYSSDTTRLGYPIFVYQLDFQHGLRKVRTVPRGKAVDLPH